MKPLLFLPHRIPFPPNKGDKVRSYHLLRFLAERYKVYLGTFIDDPADLSHIDRVRAYCAGAHFARLRPALARIRSVSALFSGEPLTLPYYRDAGLARWVAATLAENAIERVVVFSSCMGQFLPEGRGIHVVADFVDVDSDKWRQYSTRQQWPTSAIYAREARLLLEWERALAARAAFSLFTTPAEAELFASLAPEVGHRGVGIPNGVDATFFAPDPSLPSPYDADEPVIAFSGAMDYWPNVDAVTWFAREALPRIASTIPKVRFVVVGMNPTRAVKALARIGSVTITGRVEDIRPYLQHATVVVAPLRIARGVQNKVLEAMAMSRAVVTSTACASALSVVAGVELEVADSADAFVGKTLELLRSPRREALGAAARARVIADYSWENNLMRVAELIEDAAPARRGEARAGGKTGPAALAEEAGAWTSPPLLG